MEDARVYSSACSQVVSDNLYVIFIVEYNMFMGGSV